MRSLSQLLWVDVPVQSHSKMSFLSALAGPRVSNGKMRLEVRRHFGLQGVCRRPPLTGRWDVAQDN